MANKFILICALFLCGCSHYEYHGHYKFDETKLVNKVTKQKVVEMFGSPITFKNLDNVFYYAYSKNEINAFGFDKTLETKILRLEFKNDILVKSEIFNYNGWNFDKETTKCPEMDIDLMFEMIESIGKLQGIEEGSQKVSDLGGSSAPAQSVIPKS